jgi:large subunit ribosomal protein L32e
MVEIKKSLETRKVRNRRKPLFVRRDARTKSRVPFKWRKPHGKHSPVRQRHKGKIKVVSIGYGTPKEIKHLDDSGLEKVMVYNQKDLEKVDSQKQGVVISKRTGNNKRIEIIKMAMEKKITVFNFRDAQEYLNSLEQSFIERKKAKQKKTAEKDKKEQEKKKKAEEKEKKDTETEKKEETGEKTETEIEEEKKAEKELAEKTIIKKQ